MAIERKKHGMGVWNSIFILLTVFPIVCKKANRVYSATRFKSATQSSAIPHDIYLQLFYAVSLIATVHD